MKRLPAYFTHSYRASDRAVNRFFWGLCCDAGFDLVVDPKAENLSVARLEKLIKTTSASIGVFTLREEEPYLRCSPYALLEYGLCIQARAPLLVFAEDSIAGNYFDEMRLVTFRRDKLKDSEGRARAALESLRASAEARQPALGGLLGTIALLCGPKSRRMYPDTLVKRIKDTVRHSGFRFVLDNLEFDLPHTFALRLDRYDAVIVDVSPRSPDRWVLPYVYARFVPSIRLYSLEKASRIPTAEDLFDILSAQVLLERTSTDDVVVFWRDVVELVTKIEAQLQRLRQPHTELYPVEQGERYLESLGRPSEDVQVFISNARDADDFARRLSQKMYLANLQHFHYRAASDIPIGAEWSPLLKQRVMRSQIFVALLTKAYQHSPWCMQELSLARENAETHIIPYYLERDAAAGEVLPQGRPIERQDDAAAEQIVRDVDTMIREKFTERKPLAGSDRHVDSRDLEPPVDIVILSVKPEEYAAVLRHLDYHRIIEPTRTRPNLFSWEYGEVRRASDGRPYRLVVGLVGHQGQIPAADATKESLRNWQPRLCLLVGIAGGIASRKVKIGDVVVSTEIWHYEFGAVDNTFEPSTRRIFQVNGPLLTSAMTLHINHPTWAGGVRAQSPTKVAPGVVPGVVASGDKVIQRADSAIFAPVMAKEKKVVAVEMEGGGAAAAVNSQQQQGVGVDGTNVGFLMIRGISDLVREGQAEAEVGNQQNERKSWTEYASAAAAQFAAELIRRRWPVAPRE